MLVIAFAGVIVIGSVAEINAQSGGYRSSVNSGYAELAAQVVTSSNHTGADLATLVDRAPTLANGSFGPASTGLRSARAELQQGLDRAVADAEQQSTQAAHLVPPYPTGTVSAGFARVMAARSTAVAELRTAIDQLLGMEPLPVAGAPTTTATGSPAGALSTVGEASTAMGAAGLLLQSADTSYRSLTSTARAQRPPIRLPRSVWVPDPRPTAPLGAVQLAALAPALHASGALVAFHQLVITAVGLVPSAVASGASGTIGTGCGVQAQSTVAGPTPSVLPPTATLGVELTVTNCGTVEESGETVTETLAPADPAGTALPPPGQRGGVQHASLAPLPPVSSVSLTLPALAVAGGHTYTLGLTVTVPPGQLLNPDGAAGTSQQFLVQISG